MEHKPMFTPMTKAAIESASPLILFRNIFGFKPEQKLTDFVQETRTLKEDTIFVDECKAYALAHAVA